MTLRVAAQLGDAPAFCNECGHTLDMSLEGDEETVTLTMGCPLGCDYALSYTADNQADTIREMEPPS